MLVLGNRLGGRATRNRKGIADGTKIGALPMPVGELLGMKGQEVVDDNSSPSRRMGVQNEIVPVPGEHKAAARFLRLACAHSHLLWQATAGSTYLYRIGWMDKRRDCRQTLRHVHTRAHTDTHTDTNIHKNMQPHTQRHTQITQTQQQIQKYMV